MNSDPVALDFNRTNPYAVNPPAAVLPDLIFYRVCIALVNVPDTVSPAAEFGVTLFDRFTNLFGDFVGVFFRVFRGFGGPLFVFRPATGVKFLRVFGGIFPNDFRDAPFSCAAALKTYAAGMNPFISETGTAAARALPIIKILSSVFVSFEILQFHMIHRRPSVRGSPL